MRQPGVVLPDVEVHELSHVRNRIQLVQEEPVVFQGTPPGLDHRVRVADLRHRQDPPEKAGLDQLVHPAIPVLDARVGEEHRRVARPKHAPPRLEQHGDRVPDGEVIVELPGQDPPREVVDDRVEVRLRSVEESDDRRVDVPDLVRLRGADPDSRTFRMNSQPRPAPAVLSNEPEPR